MTVEWTFTITPVDISNKIARVVAVRADDTDPDSVFTVTSENADISTTPKKIAALDALWAKYQDQVAAKAELDAIQSVINDLETSAKTNFEGREP